jgi:hypothetical protein
MPEFKRAVIECPDDAIKVMFIQSSIHREKGNFIFFDNIYSVLFLDDY